MKQLNSLLAASIVLAAGITSSLAGTLGPTTTSTPITLTLTDWTGSLLFPQFDPSLGTLNSVELDFSSSLTTTLTVTNNSGSSSSGTAQTELQVTVQDAGNNLTAPELDLISTAYSYSLGAGQGVTSGLLSKSGLSSDLYTLGTILSEFTGVGNISLSAGTFTQTLLANTGGNTAASQITDASLTGTVTYNYTEPVPEPASFGLLVLGLGALPLLRQRR